MVGNPCVILLATQICRQCRCWAGRRWRSHYQIKENATAAQRSPGFADSSGLFLRIPLDARHHFLHASDARRLADHRLIDALLTSQAAGTIIEKLQFLEVRCEFDK